MTHALEDEVLMPRKTNMTPSGQCEMQMHSVDEAAMDTLLAVLEELLSVNHLRQHAQEACNAATIDSASPAALLAAMDDSLTVPMSYLLTLPAVRNAVPSELNNERTADLFAAATRMSQKVVLRNTPKGLRLGPFPQAFPRSRCTLHIQGVSSTVTVSDVQEVIPQHPIFHFYRLSPDTINIAFENAWSAKEAFVLLQGKTVGGCTSVQVKMRMENKKHPKLVSQRRTSKMGTNSATSTPANAKPTAASTAVAATATTTTNNSVSSVVRLDASVSFSKMEDSSFAWSSWSRPPNSETMHQPYCSTQQHHADMSPFVGRRRMSYNDPMNGMFSEHVSSNMNFMTMPRYMWDQAAATAPVATTAANVNDLYQRPWEENESPSMNNTVFASSSNGKSVRSYVLTPPCPVGDDYSSLEESVWLPFASRPDPDIMGCHTPYMFDVLPRVKGGRCMNGHMDNNQHTSNGAGWETRRRRVQRDPYKGGILVDSPELSNDFLSTCVSPGSVVNYKPRRIDCRILSPRMLHASSSEEAAERPKLVVSATDDESPTQLTPYETSSQTQSEADSSGPRQIRCGES
ncbi:hypothetical protein TraAM80_01468 [Trypanosoma rangeli]|uniref:RNA-binding protein n=1 Tax=Trypanosoma rangeli TaxID=5698 RepID=A0A422NYG0_TRYRA|nr:uncharacterized protein TraAM80_01468 [Trypanosoma rangeli]RNF10543.1 hypothetical protein TraAM80_01468 [Trypanosoma rangeli]|eukprot:RNF10543.1 hypothetical protein TraAM80_01468 [Trypanosoma rangeli]